VKHNVRKYSRHFEKYGGTYTYNAIIDGFGDMFRKLVSVGASLEVHKFSKREWLQFITGLATITQYSSQSGRSHRLSTAILNSLDANEVRQIQARLVNKEFLARIKPYHRLQNLKTLFGAIETPLSLKYISRGAIIRAMSQGCNEDVETLEIPKHLQEYIHQFY